MKEISMKTVSNVMAGVGIAIVIGSLYIRHPTNPTTGFAKAKAGRTAGIVYGFKSRLCSPQ